MKDGEAADENESPLLWGGTTLYWKDHMIMHSIAIMIVQIMEFEIQQVIINLFAYPDS